MHELGIVMEIIDRVEAFAKDREIKNVKTLVLEIGELSSIVPSYIEEMYAVVKMDSMLDDTSLSIEIIPGVIKCRDCGERYPFSHREEGCPTCSNDLWFVFSGAELTIKEIVIE